MDIRKLIRKEILKEFDLSHQERESLDRRNRDVLQSKMQPIEIATKSAMDGNGTITTTPEIWVSPTNLQVKLKDGKDEFFSISIYPEGVGAKAGVYIANHGRYVLDENFVESIMSVINAGQDYASFLTQSQIEKAKRLLTYLIRKNEHHVNITAAL